MSSFVRRLQRNLADKHKMNRLCRVTPRLTKRQAGKGQRKAA